MKLQLRVTLLLIVALAIFGSLDWQSATVIEPSRDIAINGFAALPQLGLVIAIQLLLLFGSRYWSRTPGLIAVVIGFTLSALAISPVFALLFGEPQLLQNQIAALTGIADFQSQLEGVKGLHTQNTFIALTAVAACLAAVWSLRLPFVKRHSSGSKSADGEWLN
ncbi:unannotated protein [freshwater metagenome]|uniref:Unannotated protein n=1 Tax=freshwater metagenome TaxID=449393 RepID=A0A6J7KTE5_9ZZZZ|nr:hypothetical protein [Actinomycetota bacterium]